MNYEKLVKIFGLLLILGVLNVILYTAEINLLGGTAFLGQIENGKYYLGQGGHFNEVSAAVYYFNKSHTIIVFLHIIVVIILALWLKFTGHLND